MPMYLVEATETRVTQFFIEAPNGFMAEDTANELVEVIPEGDWLDEDMNVDITPLEGIPSGMKVWIGGPEGKWVIK